MIVAIVRLYDSHAEAANAVETLRQAGVPERDISLLTREDPVAGAARGAEIGATLGGLVGLAAALGLAVPGIGPVLATGWLAATAAGAAAGGLAGGALGLLSQAGLSGEDAHEIAECLRRGYWNNRYEVEAREFADRHSPQLHALLQIQPSSDSRR